MSGRKHVIFLIYLLILSFLGTIFLLSVKGTRSMSEVEETVPDEGSSYALQLKQTKNGRRYYMVEPKNLSSKGKLPLVVFLHGQGDSNYSLFTSHLPQYNIIKNIQSGKAYQSGEFIFLVPHMYWNDGEGWSAVKPFIDEMKETYKNNVDTSKIILMGHSTGGAYTWSFVNAYGKSNYLYKAVVFSAYTQADDSALGNFTKTPMWFIGGTQTGIEERYRTNTMKNIAPKINNKGGDVRVSVIDGAAHEETLDFFMKKASTYTVNAASEKMGSYAATLGDYGKNLFDWILGGSDDLAVTFSSLSVDKTKKIIKNISLGTKYSSILNKITTNGNISLISNDNNTISGTSKVKTGDKLKITLNNKTVTYTISVLGDLDGDGEIKINDVSKLYRYIKGKVNLTDTYIYAGEVVADGEIKINDVSKLYRYLKGKIGSLN